jgi:membrane-associated phospholipid phosphatase
MNLNLARHKNALFMKGRHRLIAAAILAFVCGTGFAAIGTFNRHRFGLTLLPSPQAFALDRYIPFVPEWIWVYLLYYPFCFLPLFIREVRNDPRTFRRTLTAFALQFIVSFAFFVFLPLRMAHAGLPSGLNGQVIGSLYGFDLGFNSFPSLHLANIVFVSCLFIHLRGKYWGLAVGCGALLIAASTLLIKQHFVSDVLLGAFLGWGSFALAFYAGNRVNLEGSSTPVRLNLGV